MRVLLLGLLVSSLLAGPVLAGPPDPKEVAGGQSPDGDGQLFEAIVAVVGNRVITRYDLGMAMLPRLGELPSNVPKAEREAAFQNLQREVLQNVIDNELVLVAADRQGIEVSKRDVDAQLKQMLSLPTLSHEALERAAYKLGFESVEHLREVVRDKLKRERVVMMQVRARVKVSDRELDQAFAEHYPGDRYRAVEIAHILFALSPQATLEKYQQVLAHARTVLEEIRSGAISFEEAAMKYSDDKASAEDQGKIGFVTEGTLEKDFEDAVFSLKVGQVSEPVRTRLGVHLIKVVGEELRPFRDEAQKQEFKYRLRGLLEEAAYEKAFRRWLDQLRQNTRIDIRL